MDSSRIFTALHDQLHWPSQDEIFNPTGSGPAVYAKLVKQKIGNPIERMSRGTLIRTGVLTGDPTTHESEPPIAIVCEFSAAITETTLYELHKLAWNFTKSPILVTVEPHLLRLWSCYEAPAPSDSLWGPSPITEEPIGSTAIFKHLIDTLHWVHIVSGRFFSENSGRFPLNQKADASLLANLKCVRKKLLAPPDGLKEDIAHDLLARLIFIQYLFQRKDSSGQPALNVNILSSLHENKILTKGYTNLNDILKSKKDTYALFKWLNNKFNGDLFPKNVFLEMKKVRKKHLDTLSDFVSGKMTMEGGQHCLWPLYSFDAIPLEFISNIYEEFIKNPDNDISDTGKYYTPMHLVDFVLDKVLPWAGHNYKLKILDPACGSGAFLVKAFQRLVYRWQVENPNQNPSPSLLRSLLENYIFGCDTDLRAVRTASFSLYLAMCDQIEPRYLWTRVSFPSLRDNTLKNEDFFSENVNGIRTVEDARQYDLVIGNAPWGTDSLKSSDKAKSWASAYSWPTAHEQIGTLFLPKAAALTSNNGQISMIQSASALLFNHNSTALEFRKIFFDTYKIDEVVNFAALRFSNFFTNATGPTCLITFKPQNKDNQPFAYWFPKNYSFNCGINHIWLDDSDLNWIYPAEAANLFWIWGALSWGSRRDYELIKRLQAEFPSLGQKVHSEIGWRLNYGYKRGAKRANPYKSMLDHPTIEEHSNFGESSFVTTPDNFPLNKNELFERPRSLDQYTLPSLIIKESWTKSIGRFKGILALKSSQYKYLLHSQSYWSVQTPEIDSLAKVATFINSKLAVHYFFHISGRLSGYRPTLQGDILELMPVSFRNITTLQNLSKLDLDQIDEIIFNAYGLSEVERILVEDFFEVTLQDFKDGLLSSGNLPVYNSDNPLHINLLRQYCHIFIKVIQSCFGQGKNTRATIYTPANVCHAPFCVVAIHLEWPYVEEISEEKQDFSDFIKILEKLNKQAQKTSNSSASIFYQRQTRIYKTIEIKKSSGKSIKSPTVYIVKPNKVRYWTRSRALHDADKVSTDIFLWKQE